MQERVSSYTSLWGFNKVDSVAKGLVRENRGPLAALSTLMNKVFP